MAETATRLTGKREAFVWAYLGPARFNATKAAVLAGYAEAGARTEGSRLLANADIATRIRAELSKRALPAEAVLDELADVATAEWSQFVTVRTDPRTGEQVDAKMDLGSKVKALEVLAKAHGLLTDRIDLSGQMTHTVELVGIDSEDV